VGVFSFKAGSPGILYLSVLFASLGVLEWVARGQTLGMMMFDLRAVDMLGGRLSLGASLRRHMLDWFEVFGVAVVLMARPPFGQRIGDLLANARVVETGAAADLPVSSKNPNAHES
jgi:uncharacterized RDD family membrane protein YckC